MHSYRLRSGGLRAVLAGKQFAASRRGAVSVWVGISVPVLLMAAGIGLNISQGLVARQQLQLAADLAARAGAISLGRGSEPRAAANVAVDVAELNGVASNRERAWNAAAKSLSGGMVNVALTPGITNPEHSAVTVTVSRTIPMVFAALLGVDTDRTVSASGIAEAWGFGMGGGGAGGGSTCVLALNGATASAIKVDNLGRIQAPECDIVANSTAAGTGTGAAIYLNSGTISGKSIGTPGKVCLSNSGSNTVSPTIANNSCISPATPVKADPFGTLAVPAPVQAGCAVNATYGACCIPPVAGTVNGVSSTATNVVGMSYTGWQATPRTFSPANGGVFCGNTTIGGNGAADKFAPGIYYVINGNLTFNNSAIVEAEGVSFVLIGRNGGNPGAISWTNYSNTYTLSAPSTGPTANILFWQTCKADGTAPTNTMAGGSTLTMAGAFYAKCGALNMTNNIHMNAATGAAFKVVANTIYVAGSAAINASIGSAPPPAASVALVR